MFISRLVRFRTNFFLVASLLPFILSALFFAPLTSAIAASGIALQTEVALPPFQNAKLVSDAPIRQVELANTETLWVLGQKDLWRWDLRKGALTKWTFDSPSLVAGVKALKAIGDNLWLATDGKLIRVSMTTQIVSSYDFPSRSAGKTLAIFERTGGVTWLRTDGVANLDTDGELPSLVAAPGKLASENDLALFLESSNTLWLGHNGSLVRKRILDGSVKAQTIYKSTSKMIALRSDGQDVYLVLSDVILRYGLDGELKQGIPIAKTRKIVDAAFNAETHAFIFSDGALELYNVGKQKGCVFRVGSKDDAFDKLTVDAGFVAHTASGVPKAWRLECN